MLLGWITNHGKELISLLVPFLSWLLNRQFQPNAKLIKVERQGFVYSVPEPLRDPHGNVVRPSQWVRTATVSVMNTGRLPAKNIEIVFNWRPQFFNVWPVRAFSELASNDGRFSIVLTDLAPKEEFSIHTLAINADLPAVANVRSEQSTAVEVPIGHQVIQPRWKIFIAGWLMFVGLVASVYLLLTVLEFALR